MSSFASLVGKFDYRTLRPLPSFYKPGPVPRPTLAPHLITSSETYAKGNGRITAPTDDVDDDPINLSLRAPRSATGTRIDLGEDYYANDGIVPIFRYVER